MIGIDSAIGVKTEQKPTTAPMRKQSWRITQAIILFLLLGFSFFLYLSVVNSPAATLATAPALALSSKQISPGLPARLIIPAINVDTAVESLSLNKDGTMAVPENLSNVGWYQEGPKPGEIGSAVIDGHYGNWLDGQTGIFNDLSKLQTGDKIFVEDSLGQRQIFIVKELKTYNSAASAKEIFTSTDRGIHLNLITCDGAWNNATQSYSERLVVFSDKE